MIQEPSQLFVLFFVILSPLVISITYFIICLGYKEKIAQAAKIGSLMYVVAVPFSSFVAACMGEFAFDRYLAGWLYLLLTVFGALVVIAIIRRFIHKNQNPKI